MSYNLPVKPCLQVIQKNALWIDGGQGYYNKKAKLYFDRNIPIVKSYIK